MHPATRDKLTDHFVKYISDPRRLFLEKVLSQRTRHITMVLEDIYQSQNASAVIRTCECMGVQDIHIIEYETKVSLNKDVVKGSIKWVDIIKYQKGKGADQCFQQLKQNGYKILVTDPSPDGVSIYDVDVNDKIALVMGNELRGTSERALSHADLKVKIPMYGFTESMNISVSAAVCLNTLIPKVHQSNAPWQLTVDEMADIRLRWLRKMMKRPEIMEKEFLKSIL
jgi:tRNA (guanosine-2'-O-)-methyltransferase